MVAWFENLQRIDGFDIDSLSVRKGSVSAPEVDLVVVRDRAEVPFNVGDSDLWSGEVLEDRDPRAHFGGDPSNVVEHSQVLLVAAVREVEPKHVGTSFDQFPDALRRAGGGAQGGNDLGPAMIEGALVRG